MKNPLRFIGTLLLMLLMVPPSARAQWQPNGVAACADPAAQQYMALASDGANGTIIVWRDARVLGGLDIYAQRLNASGAPQWTANGVAICTAEYYQVLPVIISDGAGGAIIAWQDERFGPDIYAQRVNGAGLVQWTTNGVAVCDEVNFQSDPALFSDGAGGAIVTWSDTRNFGLSDDIYAQRINTTGVVQWAANGIPICSAAGSQRHPSVLSDGAGGAIIAWNDHRGSTWDIYTQRVNAAGVVQWTATGVAVCVASGDQAAPDPVALVADGSGGVIMTWFDPRPGSTSPDIYAQRLNAAGVPQWQTDGLAVCNAANLQGSPAPVPDGTGGVIVTWHDLRTGSNMDIYAQRVSATGAFYWGSNGVPLCMATNDQQLVKSIPDGVGGAVVAWSDARSGSANDIYAQRVNSQGAPQWITNGVAICTATGDQSYAQMIATGNGGAIVEWDDTRNGNVDVYAQRFDFRYGQWGHPEPAITSVADIRGDQGGKVKVNWTGSDLDALNNRTITHYSVWRGSDVATFLATSQRSVVADPARVKQGFGGRAVWKQRVQDTDYYWEWVGNQDAIYQHSYTFSADTRADSTSQSQSQTHFMVLAHTADDFTFWPSNEMAGHSVDNLAPTPPLALTAQRVGYDVHLNWNRVRVSDLKNYAVYRRSTSGVTPIPMNFLNTANDTVLVDTGAPVTALYYIVTANDVHENQGAASNEANVPTLTGIGDAPPIATLTVLQNYPNPFAGITDLAIGLPSESDVSIQIYDVAGRVVRSERVPRVGAGWQRVSLSDRGDNGKPLASGVYFYRVTASGSTVTKKMVIAR